MLNPLTCPSVHHLADPGLERQDEQASIVVRSLVDRQYSDTPRCIGNGTSGYETTCFLGSAMARSVLPWASWLFLHEHNAGGTTAVYATRDHGLELETSAEQKMNAAKGRSSEARLDVTLMVFRPHSPR